MTSPQPQSHIFTPPHSASDDEKATERETDEIATKDREKEKETELDREKETAHADEEKVGGILKEGWLTKKGAKRRNWQTRWFILRASDLSYYKRKGVCPSFHSLVMVCEGALTCDGHRTASRKGPFFLLEQ
jgi:hypothetical protein